MAAILFFPQSLQRAVVAENHYVQMQPIHQEELEAVAVAETDLAE
jgi:hypothetical protein